MSAGAKEYGGLLAVLSETQDIISELGLSYEEAQRVQRQRSAERLAEYHASKLESNVIYGVNFAAKPDPEAA